MAIEQSHSEHRPETHSDKDDRSSEEPMKNRVPKEDATIEEIKTAVARTGRAAESFLPSEEPSNADRTSNARR